MKGSIVMYDAIGGYFGLEISDRGSIYHDTLVALNSARNAFEYSLRINEVKKIHIPYYICDVVLQPLKKLGIDYDFYQIDRNMEPVDEFDLDDHILYVNYFGLKDDFIQKLSKKYVNLIVDSSQAFFTDPVEGTDTFYSPRKYFGLPDGGFLYTTCEKLPNFKIGKDISVDRSSHLLKRTDLGPENGYEDFKSNDADLDDRPIMYMSDLTKKIMRGIDFRMVQRKREQNFRYLHRLLKDINILSGIFDTDHMTSFMVYPFISNDKGLRKKLIDNRIFVAKYWPSVERYIDKQQSNELYFTNNLLPLPIDQRYDKEDMERVLEIVSDDNY